jgi:hypothetical protein
VPIQLTLEITVRATKSRPSPSHRPSFKSTPNRLVSNPTLVRKENAKDQRGGYERVLEKEQSTGQTYQLESEVNGIVLREEKGVDGGILGQEKARPRIDWFYQSASVISPSSFPCVGNL